MTITIKRYAGQNLFGAYEDLSICGEFQRMRWMPPRIFLMGSPEGEAERDNCEVQHEVKISKAFWLADTACTQALWQAVMGDNPSKFKGPDKPVENVSWNDCQEFIQKINESDPELNLRLPTEAQWEYACRAGTKTPFSFGENITSRQVNYDGNYPYADGQKGESRQETVGVKSRLANNWGFFGMHGNVWEWCADWYGPYESGLQIDPQGPMQGENRVLRGGSWFSYAGYCRSAYRSMFHPGNRAQRFGFRLSRGQ